MATNPFTPTFGVTPPLLAGRDEELAVFHDALDDGAGAPGRAMIFTGSRGSGKTVMLNAVEDAARDRGWVVVSETSRPGLAESLSVSVLPSLLAKHDPNAVTTSITGGSGSIAGTGGGVQRSVREQHAPVPSLRSQLELLTDVLASEGVGVLISLDEIHRAAIEDLRQITQVVQHAFREGRDVAFVAAGLPSSVNDLLSDDVLTFLRRAERFAMGPVPSTEVEKQSVFLLRPLAETSRTRRSRSPLAPPGDIPSWYS